MFPDKYRRVPTLLKPQQGGQQYFVESLTQTANDEVLRAAANGSAAGDVEAASSHGVYPLLPQQDLGNVMKATTAEAIAAEMQSIIANDVFTTARGFNEREWYAQERASKLQPKQSTSTSPGEGQPNTNSETGLPHRILGADYFQSCYGYSLRKEQSELDSTHTALNYAQLDLWGEMPKYHRDTIFLYLVSRRRNTYAVAYDYEGKRILSTYTAGNRGLKGGDRGFRGDGSTEAGHQVTSMYLNDIIPRIRERRATSGRPMAKDEKIEIVVRVMGFYNGRQGAVRAVQDRSNEFTVRYLEDITPFPLNGPKMPHGVFR